jgi:hypothetical protein
MLEGGQPAGVPATMAVTAIAEEWTVPSLKAVLCAALAATVLLGAPTAEARFGKRSSPSSGSKGSGGSGGSGGPRRDNDRPRTHRATPIGQERDAKDDDDDERPRRRRSRVGVLPPAVIVAGGIVGAPPPPSPRRAPVVTRVTRERHEPVPLLVRLGVQGDLLGNGGAMGMFMAMEGRRMGLDARATGIALPAEDGSSGVDRITLLGAHVTAALWASPRGRMRVEAGVTTAHALDVIFVGPSLGASVEACVPGTPLDLEARVNAVPFPHRQVDAQAGVALHLGTFNLRGGWRALYLNDAGHLGDEANIDAFGGPYLGLGFTF